MDGLLAPAFAAGMVGAQGQTKIVEAIASWCEALHGTAELQSALADLVAGLGAEAGMIVRTRLGDAQQQRVAQHDSEPRDRVIRPLRLSFADGLFGRNLERARAGTIWLGSACAELPDPFLADFQAGRHLREFCVLVLAAGPVTRDHIELHFREPLGATEQATLAAVGPTMARTWATRQIGVVTRTMGQQRAQNRTAAPPRQPILSPANPARLSRAEFRVSLLVGRGLSVRGVSEELSISEATVRSHLRNIYAKTDTGSLAELVFHLISPAKPAQAGDLRCA